jgi:hypothetical protein
MIGTAPYWHRLLVSDRWWRRLLGYWAWVAFHRAPSVPRWWAAAPTGVKSGRCCHSPRVLRRHEPGVTRSVLAWVLVDILYAALEAQGIVNVALHQEYSLGIIFIFCQGRKYLYHV